MKLTEITSLAVNEFIAQELETGRKNSTVNKYKKLMSQIFSFMIDNEVIVRNPLARIKSLREEKSEEVCALSSQEVQILLSKTKQVYPDFLPFVIYRYFYRLKTG